MKKFAYVGTGCFILTLLLTAVYEGWKVKGNIKHGLTTGIIGTYTTFSSLCKEIGFFIPSFPILYGFVY